MKLLLWAVVIFAVIWILRSKKSSAKVDTPPRKPQAAALEDEAMLTCAHCGIHFPASEAVFNSANTAFCSDEHRRLHVAR